VQIGCHYRRRSSPIGLPGSTQVSSQYQVVTVSAVRTLISSLDPIFVIAACGTVIAEEGRRFLS
jgi:hypothetical protein